VVLNEGNYSRYAGTVVYVEKKEGNQETKEVATATSEPTATATPEPEATLCPLQELILDEFEMKIGAKSEVWGNGVKKESLDLSKFVWSSSDESIVTVSSDGILYAHAAGEAMLTLKRGDESAARKVNVLPPAEEVASLSFEDTNLTIVVNKVIRMEMEITPKSLKAKDLIWTSSDENVATVSTHGGIVGVAKGKAIITATLPGYLDEKHQIPSASVEVEVVPRPESISCSNDAYVYVGEPIEIDFSVLPVGAESSVEMIARSGLEPTEGNVFCSKTAGLEIIDVNASMASGVQTTASYIALKKEDTFESPFEKAAYTEIIAAAKDSAKQVSACAEVIDTYASVSEHQPKIITKGTALAMQRNNDFWVCVPREAAGMYTHWTVYGCFEHYDQQYITCFDVNYKKVSDVVDYLNAFPCEEEKSIYEIDVANVLENVKTIGQ